MELSLTCIRPTPTLALRSTLKLEGHSTNTFKGLLLAQDVLKVFPLMAPFLGLKRLCGRIPLMGAGLRPGQQSLAPEKFIVTLPPNIALSLQSKIHQIVFFNIWGIFSNLIFRVEEMCSPGPTSQHPQPSIQGRAPVRIRELQPERWLPKEKETPS